MTSQQPPAVPPPDAFATPLDLPVDRVRALGARLDQMARIDAAELAALHPALVAATQSTAAARRLIAAASPPTSGGETW